MMDSDESRKEAQRQIAELEKKMACCCCGRSTEKGVLFVRVNPVYCTNDSCTEPNGEDGEGGDGKKGWTHGVCLNCWNFWNVEREMESSPASPSQSPGGKSGS